MRASILALLLIGCAPSVALSPDESRAAAVDMGHAGVPVLHFAGNAQHVDHGEFWKPETVLGGGFLWEMWAMGQPWNPSGYPVSDGYAGWHRLLWSGTSGNATFYDGAALQIVPFGSDDPPPEGVMSHVAVGLIADAYGNNWIATWQNGVPTGLHLVPGGAIPWPSMTAGVGSGVLYIGGSDHSNFVGDIAMIRAFDSTAPVGWAFAQPFYPMRFFNADDGAGTAASFLTSYIAPVVGIYPDLSRGYAGGYPTANTHPGFVATVDSQLDGTGNTQPPIYPLPQVVYVHNAPFDPNYVDAPPNRGYTPKAVPMGAKIYDSFSRPDQEYAHVGHPTPGSTEGGSLGPLPWHAAFIDGGTNLFAYPLGIYNRSMVAFSTVPLCATVQGDSGDVDERIMRRPALGTTSSGAIGMCFRMASDTSGWAVFYDNLTGTAGATADSTLYLFRYDGGARTIVAAVGIPPLASWSLLRVVTAGSSIKVYTDATLQIDATDATYQTAKGIGEAWLQTPPDGTQRGFDFTVF
jgi:hypothetical protein